MLNLTIWSDFACPYCYIGETRLEKAIEDLGLKDEVVIDYRAFELDPTAGKEVVSGTPERFAKKYNLTLEGAEKQIEEISDLGRDLGIDFRYASTRYSNTRDAHRLMKLAEDKYGRNTVEVLNKALFRAYFTDNLVLADPKVLLSAAKEAGMEEDEVMNMLSSDKYDDEVRFDEREASMRGVRGVPYVLFNGDFAVPGAMSIDGFKSALTRAMRRRKENEEQSSAPAHTCGPDGCRLL